MLHADVVHKWQTPPLRRSPMVYRPLRKGPGHTPSWTGALAVRRIMFFTLIIASTFLGTAAIAKILKSEDFPVLKTGIVFIYTALFAWISVSFWTVVLGFLSLMRRRNSLIIREPEVSGPVGVGEKTAVVMPVYNEDVSRVFAGLQAIYESTAKTGQLDHFHFFILSDTTIPAQVKQEQEAWERLCQQVNGYGRVFYRHRRLRIHKKSGNIADFCRRWGKQYTYMIVLDADSLMSGKLMVHLMQTMRQRPDIGILQTAPKGINQKTLIARMQQFASHLYGPLLLAGLNFWQLDEAGFWGHNAIVRLAPFMEYCALPRLSSRLPFGGEILSHDFVEAALMRRAGWGVWMAPDFKESYEELPPDLLTELERDRRWCRGNLQHLRLLGLKGIAFGHRLLFFHGNMFYFSSFLWLLSLVLMTTYAVFDAFYKPVYFWGPHNLFPHWPVHYRELSMDLLIATAVFLLLPKVLSIVWAVVCRRSSSYGGWPAMLFSAVLETVFSFFLAPVRMLFHSWYVLSALGGKLEWKRQRRHVQRTSFSRAWSTHWLGSFLALVIAAAAYEINQTLFLWLAFIAVPLIMAVPLTMFLGNAAVGAFFKRLGLFLTPPETDPPPELVRLQQLQKEFLTEFPQ